MKESAKQGFEQPRTNDRYERSAGARVGAARSEVDVALLVDWENRKWGLREHFRAAPNITSLIAAVRSQGRLVIARAYADWTQPQLAIDAPNLYRAGIEPVYAQGRYQGDGTPVKNSADVRLAVDTVALCNQLPHVGERLSQRSVLPMLSELQLKGPLLDMIERQIFEVSEAKAVSPRTGQDFIRRELALDLDYPAVTRWLEAG